MVIEKQRPGVPGLPVLVLVLGAWAWAAMQVTQVADGPDAAAAFFKMAVPVGVLGVLILKGLFMVQPNESKVLQLFGHYVGSARIAGLRWSNPFYTAIRVSLRTRNFETKHSKVNDADGNPIEIGAVVVWQVRDSAEATFEVDNYENFVHVQSEAALRQIASRYPYDGSEGKDSLRANASIIADHLKDEIQERLARAGVKIIEARFSHMAYAPEIASAMLQRQQASAMVAARRQIVEGAVGMVQDALAQLSHHNIVQLDEERKAQMVCNLLVVLCGDRGAQPVVNAGSNYQ
ncbi:MAG: SPFH domain-containing protein [Deltaproteobacteria bacterium]|nr:SPFH domain-containing protein [Deltaproteobacteria bacterium]